MIKCILVGIGGTKFTDVAILRAVEVAKRTDAVITGVTVVDFKRLEKVGPVPPGAGAFAERLREKRAEITRERIEESIAKFEDACGRAGIACRVERETGNPFELMISHARYNDLTIFGLRSLFNYGFTTEPRDALIRLVSGGVRPILAVAPELRAIRRVLVAYNGSMESAKAMRRYIQLRPWGKVSLRIVTFGGKKEHEAPLLEDAGRYCRTHGFDVETEHVAGPAKDGLIEYARNNDFDLIVMGNSARNAILRHFIGDTALHTIQEADRPLFLAQ